MCVQREMLSRALGMAVLLMSAVAASAASPVTGANISSEPLNTVYRPEQVRNFLLAAAQRRVDIAGIGDSNQIAVLNYGHDHGFQKEWADQYGMYATSVLPAHAQGGFGVMGVEYAAGAPYLSDHHDPALPQPYRDLALDPKASGAPASGGYLPAGEKIARGATLYIPTASPFFNHNNAMTWHTTFYQFPDASGQITPQVRGDGSVYGHANIHTYPSVTIPAGALGSRVDFAQRIEPSVWYNGAGRWKLFLYNHEHTYQNGPDDGMKGQLYSLWQRMENADRTSGVGYSTLLYQGGLSARDAALSLKNGTDASLAEWMRQATRLQNVNDSQAMLMVQIVHGGNDRGQTLPSVGPNAAPSNTRAGFKDNLTAIISRMREVWTAQGYDTQNLYFSVGPYHQQDLPETLAPMLADFEVGAMELADATYNVSVVRGSKMLSYRTMHDKGYYRTPDDNAHLSPAGYEAFGRMAVNQLASTVAPANASDRSTVTRLTFDLADDVEIDTDDLVLMNLTTNQQISSEHFSLVYDADALSAEFTFPGLPGTVLPVGQYEAFLNVGGGYVYNFSAIPEPAAGAMIAFAACAFTRRPRRRSY